MRIFLITAFAGLSLSGCTKYLEFTPTMASDPPYTGMEGAILQAELMSAYRKASPDLSDDLCDQIRPSFQERRSEQLTRRGDRRLEQRTYGAKCYRFKNLDNSAQETTKLVKNYLVSGFALTDLYCDNFFNRIAERTSKRRFARSGVNDVGAAISAVLGLASAGSAVTGGIGAGFGLLDSSIRNYDDSFIVDADLPSLQKLVRSEQRRISGEYLAADNKNIPSTYQEAAIAITRYANTCTFTGMRGLLTESMVEKSSSNSRILEFQTLTPVQKREVLERLGFSTEEIEKAFAVEVEGDSPQDPQYEAGTETTDREPT